MRFLWLIIVIAYLPGCRSPQAAFRTQVTACSNLSTIAEAEPANPLSASDAFQIEDLVQLGINQNPRIKAAAHRVQSLAYRIPQALALPDPTVNTATHLAPVETAAGRQAFSLGINQRFVDVDRRATAAAIADDEVRAAEAELKQIRLEVAEQVRVVAAQLLAIEESIQITEQDLQSLAQIENVILRRYEVQQTVTQQDVLNVQVEQSKVVNELTRLKQIKDSYSARLARLVGKTPGWELKLSDSLEDVTINQDVESLIAQAWQARPELAAQLSRVIRDRRKIALAKLQAKPDFTVGLNWIATSMDGISPVANGDDAVLLGIGFNLPVNKHRIRAAACEASEASLASSAKLESLQDQISEEVFDTAMKLESANSTLTLLQEDILPKAERTLELAIEEYSNGQSDYTLLISNWRSLLRYRISIANLQAQRMQLSATLARQIGQLEPLEN